MFIYDIQYGGDPYTRYDVKGVTDYDRFMDAFTAFPWLDEIEKSNANPEGCSPTLSVKNQDDEKDFWVSMSGDRTNHGYLLGYVYLKTVRRFFGLGKEKTVKWVVIYLTENKQLVKEYFLLYFNRDYDALFTQLERLEKYGAMEAQN